MTQPKNYVTNPALRSDLMRAIRSKNSKAEMLAFIELRRRGVTFQRHYSRVPGKPDIAKPRKKLALFIDGDFWHGRSIDRIIAKHGPESEWATKLRRNVERDRSQEHELLLAGWAVLRVWESELMAKSSRAETLDRMEAFLRSKG